MAANFFDRLPRRCPLFGGRLQAFPCPPPRPVQGGRNRTEITKERTSNNRKDERKWSSPLFLFCGCREGVGGERQGFLNLGTQLFSLTLLSSTRSLLSRDSHSDASLSRSSSTGGGTRLPTSVGERKYNTDWLHLVSAKSQPLFSSAAHLSHFRPQDFLRRLPVGTVFVTAAK
jgi:hypothetical protein